jgi:hypothetical protein
MSVLPSFLVESALKTAAAAQNVLAIPKEYGVDFSTGQLTGSIVEGIEAIKVWIWSCIHTERYRYAIYTWQHGTEYEQYIGQTVTDEYLQSDCLTETEEALLVNPYITEITDFTAEMNRDTLHISFRAETLYGEVVVSEYV